MNGLTHVDETGQAQMVDIGGKPESARMARASCIVTMQPQTLDQLCSSQLAKGDAWQVARLAGIAAAKQTGQLIPLCHPLRLNRVQVELSPCPPNQVKIDVRVSAFDRTGVEMEALTAAAVAALTLYDMCKAIDRDMVVGPLQLEEKRGGQHGDYVRQDSSP